MPIILRVPRDRAAIALLVLGLLIVSAAGWAAEALAVKQGNQTRLSVTKRREIPYKHVLQIPQDYPWLFESSFALHPDGKRAAILLPKEKDLALRKRPEKNLPERSFELAWMDLASGQVLHSREFVFHKYEGFGFSLSPDGHSVCAIAAGHVMILDDSFRTLDWIDSEMMNPAGGKLRADGCSYVAGESRVLLEFTNATRQTMIWKTRRTLVLWDWQTKTAWGPLSPDLAVYDAKTIGDSRALLYRQIANWLYRFRLEEIDLMTGKTAASEYPPSRGFETSKLALSRGYVFRVEQWRGWPEDTLASEIVPSNFNDRHEYVWEIEVRERSNPEKIRLLHLTGKILVWTRQPQEPVEFSMSGHALHWPLAVSGDERWFVVRAVRFKYWEDNQTPSWESNRFVFFALDGSKRRLYTSQKFGPQEAITGFALSPDNQTLVVATSRRLLIYDVQEGPAK